jgi:hypothetical protein
MFAGGSVDALDPQPSKRSLAVAPIAIGILKGLLDSLNGDPKSISPSTLIAAGLLDDFPVSGVGRDTPFDARHDRSLLKREA